MTSTETQRALVWILDCLGFDGFRWRPQILISAPEVLSAVSVCETSSEFGSITSVCSAVQLKCMHASVWPCISSARHTVWPWAPRELSCSHAVKLSLAGAAVHAAVLSAAQHTTKKWYKNRVSSRHR